MKKTALGMTLAAQLFGSVALAENIGVSMALFDDNFLTVLRNGMQDYAATLDGVTIQIEDAQNDVGKQLNLRIALDESKTCRPGQNPRQQEHDQNLSHQNCCHL